MVNVFPLKCFSKKRDFFAVKSCNAFPEDVRRAPSADAFTRETVKLIYVEHFIHDGNPKCYTDYASE